jgi:hypothetical protein
MRNLLPERFQFSHDYCLYLHDRLVRFLTHGESTRAFRVTLKFESEESAREFAEHDPTRLFDFLERHQHIDTIGELLLKGLFPALLSDFCHFVFESLSCSRKAKLTVAYALLRKPLRENLHYLEWLLVDPSGFLTTFYNEEPSQFAIDQSHDPQRRKDLISRAVTSLPHIEGFDAEWIYDARYNKNAHFSFDALSNQAIHLITTRPSIRTARQNFNFLFSNQEALESQWLHIYTVLPYLLRYTVEICEVLMTLVMKEPMDDFEEVSLHRSIGFLAWTCDSRRLQSLSLVAPPPALLNLGLVCTKCAERFSPTEDWYRTLFLHGRARCPRCRRRLLMKDIELSK